MRRRPSSASRSTIVATKVLVTLASEYIVVAETGVRVAASANPLAPVHTTRPSIMIAADAPGAPDLTRARSRTSCKLCPASTPSEIGAAVAGAAKHGSTLAAAAAHAASSAIAIDRKNLYRSDINISHALRPPALVTQDLGSKGLDDGRKIAPEVPPKD